MLDNVPPDVADELGDPKYANRLHYSRSTYRDGCRGPLCQKSERDRARFRSQVKAMREGREYKPNKRDEDAVRRDELLDSIISTHHAAYKLKKLLPITMESVA